MDNLDFEQELYNIQMEKEGTESFMREYGHLDNPEYIESSMRIYLEALDKKDWKQAHATLVVLHLLERLHQQKIKG
jgi:hypothetical protein